MTLTTVIKKKCTGSSERNVIMGIIDHCDTTKRRKTTAIACRKQIRTAMEKSSAVCTAKRT